VTGKFELIKTKIRNQLELLHKMTHLHEQVEEFTFQRAHVLCKYL